MRNIVSEPVVHYGDKIINEGVRIEKYKMVLMTNKSKENGRCDYCHVPLNLDLSFSSV